MSSLEKFRHIVRIAGRDVDGSLKVLHGLAKIKGVGFNLARSVLQAAGVDFNLRMGHLTDQQINKLEEVLSNPMKYELPSWTLNRRRDPQTGGDLLSVEADLDLAVKSDIDLMKKIKCWKGLRHAWGLKVRGQRTKTTGRKGVAVGVTKKPG